MGRSEGSSDQPIIGPGPRAKKEGIGAPDEPRPMVCQEEENLASHSSTKALSFVTCSAHNVTTSFSDTLSGRDSKYHIHSTVGSGFACAGACGGSDASKSCTSLVPSARISTASTLHVMSTVEVRVMSI